MDPARDIVITGLGLACPIGIGREQYWTALCKRQSGVGPLTLFPSDNMPVKIAAELKDFDAKQFVKPRKALKVMCRDVQVAFSAAMLAVDDAQLDTKQVDPDRFGVVFGSQMLYGDVPEFEQLYQACVENDQFHFDRFGKSFPNKLFPLWMLKYLPNMGACHVAIALDARGPNNSIVLGEVSSLLAIIEAASVIARGRTDIMLAGGMGSRIDLTGWMYRGDIGLSHRNDQPWAASRPFDRDRDGMVNGEGSGVLVLETRAHAESRGVKPLATILGHGRTVNTEETEEGMTAAIRRSADQALSQAGIVAEQLDHVNAHGLSTLDHDRLEAAAIQTQLGNTPVTAPKSYFGNIGPGGGSVELAASVLALDQQLVPPTLNFENPDPTCPVQVIHGEPTPLQKEFVLKLSQSGTGQAVALVIRRG